jgi:hypothetical protein
MSDAIPSSAVSRSRSTCWGKRITDDIEVVTLKVSCPTGNGTHWMESRDFRANSKHLSAFGQEKNKFTMSAGWSGILESTP